MRKIEINTQILARIDCLKEFKFLINRHQLLFKTNEQHNRSKQRSLFR